MIKTEKQKNKSIRIFKILYPVYNQQYNQQFSIGYLRNNPYDYNPKKSSKLIVRGITLTLKLITNGSNVFEKTNPSWLIIPKKTMTSQCWFKHILKPPL
jgi:hypothetical protein